MENHNQYNTNLQPSRTSRPLQNTVIKPKSMTEVVSEILINWFLYETPSADEVKLVPNSLQLIDEKHNVWKARVQTFLFFPSSSYLHENSVRFAVDCIKNKNNGKDYYVIHHNYLIFPPFI